MSTLKLATEVVSAAVVMVDPVHYSTSNNKKESLYLCEQCLHGDVKASVAIYNQVVSTFVV